MIHKYRFKNFFSFAEETEVSFVLNRQVPHSDLVFESPGGTRLSKVLAVIGPNASGKTTVLKPLPFLGWFIAHSFTTTKPEKENPVMSHFFSDMEDSKFEIEFEVNGQHYRYSLVINPERVVMDHCIKRQANSSALFSGVTGLRLIRVMTSVSRISDLRYVKLKKSARMHR